MKELVASIESLSFGSIALVVAIVSATIAVGLSRIRSTKFKWLSGLVAPFFVAYFLYWSPVYLGADPSEYSAWSGIFIFPWYAAGAVASAIALKIMSKIRHE